jgi:hypothetical protein
MVGGYGAGADPMSGGQGAVQPEDGLPRVGAGQHVRRPGRLLGPHAERLLQVAVGGGDAGLAASARVRTSRW